MYLQRVLQCAPGGQRTTDRVNNGMTAILVALFAAVTAFGFAHVAPAHLAAVYDWRAVTPAVPVIFLALVRLLSRLL